MRRKTPRQSHEEALRATFWPTPVWGIGRSGEISTAQDCSDENLPKSPTLAGFVCRSLASGDDPDGSDLFSPRYTPLVEKRKRTENITLRMGTPKTADVPLVATSAGESSLSLV
jgi:hypothetical protein